MAFDPVPEKVELPKDTYTVKLIKVERKPSKKYDDDMFVWSGKVIAGEHEGQWLDYLTSTAPTPNSKLGKLRATLKPDADSEEELLDVAFTAICEGSTTKDGKYTNNNILEPIKRVDAPEEGSDDALEGEEIPF